LLVFERRHDVNSLSNSINRRVVVFGVVIICLFALPAYGQYGGGSGTSKDPYLICDANDMQAIGAEPNDWDKHFLLMADIDLSAYTGTSFNVIGIFLNGNPANDKPFTGVFDGNGHTISNFTYTSAGTDWIGLFGYVDGPGAEIKDLGLINPNVDAGSRLGSLVGYNHGTITGCYVEGGSVTGGGYVGGLVGWNLGTITNCHSTATVTGTGSSCIGGLVGENASGTITDCYSTGSVSGGGTVGGLVGRNYEGTMTDCYSTGSVSGGSRVGGLVGTNYEGGMTDCYSTGSVTGGGERVGGLVGNNSGGVTNCYSSGSVTGTGSNVGGLVGFNSGGAVSNCYATGNVTGGGISVGGLVGFNGSCSGINVISNCYSTGSVTGNSQVGGLVGLNGFCNPSEISNCYATGSVTGNSQVGGLVGLNNDTISASFWDKQTSGRTNMCGSQQFPASGCDDDKGKTTAEMQTESTFTSAGWDFVSVWDICEGTNYARLVWQVLVGDLVCPDGVNFIDFAYFADWWPQTGCGVCGGADLTGDGNVGLDDLREFADNWLTGIEPPSHDKCNNAVVVEEGVVFSGSTVGATGTDISSCAFNDSLDMWHSYTPTSSGLVTISLCGISFDTTLAVYDGCGGTELACNDDFCGLQSELAVNLTAGTTYLIRVAGYDGDTGNYALTVN
jgi:hypothetical protein